MAKLPNDDLFEGTKMSFGQHLEELRVSLFKALAGIALGAILGLFVANYVVGFIQTPLKRALTKYYVTKAEEKLAEEYKGNVPLEMLNTVTFQGVIPENLNIDPAMLVSAMKQADPKLEINFKPYRFTADDVREGYFPTLCAEIAAEANVNGSRGHAIWDLLTEKQQSLFNRLAKVTSPSESEKAQVIDALNDVIEKPELHESAAFNRDYGESEETIKDIRKKLQDQFNADSSRRINKLLVSDAYSGSLRPPQLMMVSLRMWKKAEVTVQALGAHEVFMIWMKAGLVTGLIIASPWVFWQIWNFVAAGLYPHEKRYVFMYLPISLLLFLSGAGLAFFFVFDPVLDFLFSFNRSMNIDPDPRISEWLSFVLFLPLGFGIAFQLPLVMVFINRIGIIDVRTYLEKWRIAILVIFVLSMLLTPADPVSMLLMAVPMTVLYFGGIALCKWMPRGRNPFTEAYEA